MIHTFSTDLLNQILFAEQSFRSELLFLLDRLSSERPKMASGTSFFNVNPVLFDLEVSELPKDVEFLNKIYINETLKIKIFYF